MDAPSIYLSPAVLIERVVREGGRHLTQILSPKLIEVAMSGLAEEASWGLSRESTTVSFARASGSPFSAEL
jgi:hypothetical protein